MKKIISFLLLIICMLLQIQSIAQVKKPKADPATQQMPDMEKMLKELPADQQAMAKQMIGNATGKTTAVKKETPAPPPSPIIQIKLAKPVKAPTEAQATDRLLWYKGKKINDSMLITTSAMVVQYSEKRNIVIAQPLEETDPFREMVKEVSKEQKMTDDFIETEAAKPNSWANYPIIQAAADQMAITNKQFNNAIKNTVDLPESPNNRPATGKDKGAPAGKPSKEGSKNCDAVNEKTKNVLQKQHASLLALLNNPSDMSFDAPPKQSFSMSFNCKDVQEKYWLNVKQWKENVVAYESSLINKAKALEITIQLSGSGHECSDKISPGLSTDIEKSMKLGLSRLEEKIAKLANAYGKDIFRQVPVMLLALEYKRQRQLIGMVNPEQGLIADILQLMGGPEFENYMNEQIEKKNWDVVLNLSSIWGRMQMYALFGVKGDDVISRYAKLLFRVLSMNRFALTVDIDFNERYHDDNGDDALKINGSIKTIEKVYLSLFPVNCYTWMLTTTIIPKTELRNRKMNGELIPDPEYEKSRLEYIPMQVVSGLKSIKDDKAWKNYPYSGPKDMRMYMPIFLIDFTNTDVPDTVVFQILRYVDDIPPVPVADAFTTDLTGYLNDVYMQPAATAANEEKVKEFGKDVLNKFSTIISTRDNTTALEKLKFEHAMMMQKKEVTKEFSELIYTAYTLIPFNAQNGSSTLIDVNMDTKHKNDNVEVVYGIFKLKVLHEPDPANKFLEQPK